VPLNPDDLPGDLYLDITVSGETLEPREMLTSVVWAMEVSRVWTRNPNNDLASVRLDWLNDVARIRIGGNGVGASNGLDIQTIGNTSLLRISGSGNASFKGNISAANATIGQSTTTGNVYGHGSQQIHMPGNSSNIYFNWHRGSSVHFGGGDERADISINSNGIDMHGHTVTNCGALTEANLQTGEELASDHIDRFEEGDVLCWGDGQLEKCGMVPYTVIPARYLWVES